MSNHPYLDLPPRAFWRSSVASKHFMDLEDLSDPLPLRLSDKIATAGSCFAQHIGRHLKARGGGYMDLEPAPEFFTPEDARKHGYGIFSCRYGNVYTSRQMLQLTEEAFGMRTPEVVAWQKGNRWFDALRPSVDPVGHISPDEIMILRAEHLKCVKQMIETLDVMVFTLGLTETWMSNKDGTVYPTAPGTIAGTFDKNEHEFVNLSYPDVLNDVNRFWQFVKTVNPKARLILTVSPVPLAATASGQHVLVATSHSKATLRAVAGDLAMNDDSISYFPSFEIISTHPSRGMFFNPDQRNVNDVGVQYVMKHFFAAAEAGVAADALTDPMEPICDEGKLDQFAT